MSQPGSSDHCCDASRESCFIHFSSPAISSCRRLSLQSLIVSWPLVRAWASFVTTKPGSSTARPFARFLLLAVWWLCAVPEKEKGDQLRKEGNELMSNGKTELAIKAYTAALQEQPFDSAAFSNRAKVQLDSALVLKPIYYFSSDQEI